MDYINMYEAFHERMLSMSQFVANNAFVNDAAMVHTLIAIRYTKFAVTIPVVFENKSGTTTANVSPLL